MKYDDRLLWDCNADLNSDYEYKSPDVYVVSALLKFVNSNYAGPFADYYSSLVASGDAIALDLGPFDTDAFFAKTFCFDFDLDGNISDNDALIYEVFQGWVTARGSLTLELHELNEFKQYFNSLITQGIIDPGFQLQPGPDFGPDAEVGGNKVMLPTTWVDDEPYIISTDGKIPKVKPGEQKYDESESKLGANVDASLMNFLVSDPDVKTYYDWNGTSSPRSWKKTGLTTILNIANDELKTEYGLAEPPADIIATKTLPANYIPLGTTAVLNGKTISIYKDKIAISGHYASGGVVYVYEDDGQGGYTLIYEVIVPGDFTTSLPVVELHETELFVSNPTVTSNPEIFVYNINIPNIITISNHSKLSCPLDIKQAGFASCMHINDAGDTLVVGNPTQYTEQTGNIDHYTTGQVDFPTGAIFIFKKTSSTWQHVKTIFPPDLNFYVGKDITNGSESDIQFGYSVEFVNNKILVGSPRAYTIGADRREGCVYLFENQNNDWVFTSKIESDEPKMNTQNVLTGEFNFGTSTTSTSDGSKVWILQNVPGHGTYVGEYELESSGYEMKAQDSVYKVSSNLLKGFVEIGSDDESVVYGTDGVLYLLDTT